MTDIYNSYQTMDRDNIILSFKGDITQDLLSSVYQIMESRLENVNEDVRRKKKFYHILVECLQNVYHHMERLKEDDGKKLKEENRNAIFMIGQGENNSYQIITGNFILSSNVDELKNKLDRINTMNAEELRAHYLEKLNETELSDKGGAGLGIIDIARKSGHKMQYSFSAVSDTYSFFSLEVTIK